MARKRKYGGESISLEGMDELLTKFKRLIDVIDKREMTNRLLSAGKYIADRAGDNAPKGLTKNLERGMAIFTVMAPERDGEPGVIVKPDYLIAPHFHLVEFGARGGQMPANPFFRRTIDESRGVVKSMIKRGVLEVIEEEAKK